MANDKMFPNLLESEQDMEMKPVVVGPPAYGSPDPATAGGGLVAVEDHPLDISSDFGADAGVTATPSGEFSDMTVEELKDAARDAEIQGFSSMNKAELIEALENQESEGM